MWRHSAPWEWNAHRASPDSPRRGGGANVSGTYPLWRSARHWMQQKLMPKRGRERHALRMETSEPVFRQIKQQSRGLRQFRRRGLVKVNQE